MELDGVNIDPELIRKILKKAGKMGYKAEMQLPEKAFKLGFNVGYHGHFEGVGSVQTSLEQLAVKAEKFGLKKVVLLYYNEGKTIGISKKATEITGEEKDTPEQEPVYFKRKGVDPDSEEYEMPDEPNLNDMPRAQELFKPLEVLPGVTVPKLFKMMSLLK
jgi:hypothetical protein